MSILNNDGLFDEIQRIQDEQREGWVAESKPPWVQLTEKDAQILALRQALQDATDNCLWRSDSEHPLSTEESQRIYNKAKAALSTPPPPVVPLEDVKPLVQAAQTLKDAKGRYNTGIAYERFLDAVNKFTTKHPTTK